MGRVKAGALKACLLWRVEGDLVLPRVEGKQLEEKAYDVVFDIARGNVWLVGGGAV